MKVHVHHIFVKLGISRRAQLVAQATRRHLGANPDPATAQRST